jgi:hypothetical protein
MATSSASDYLNSGRTQSAKKEEVLSRADIAELLDAADFSCDLDATIIRRSGKEKGRRHYRRGHLVSALKGIWRASTSPYGTGEILCFASVEGYAIEAVTSERAMRYKLRELERIGVIELVYAANTIRRPATYRLNISKLRERCRRSYQQVKDGRAAATPIRPRASHSKYRSSPAPAQEPSSPSTPVAPAPVPAVAPAPGSRQEQRLRDLRRQLVSHMRTWANEDQPVEAALAAAVKAFSLSSGEVKQHLEAVEYRYERQWKPSSAPLSSVEVLPPEHDHRDRRRAPKPLTSRERTNLAREMAVLMRGYTRHVEAVGGYSYDLQPDDPRYRPPMSQEHALIAACMKLCIPIEDAREALKLSGHNIDGEGKEQYP